MIFFFFCTLIFYAGFEPAISIVGSLYANHSANPFLSGVIVNDYIITYHLVDWSFYFTNKLMVKK